jgi:hypothetical protein
MPASPRYRPPPWREAASAAAYVDERLRDADSDLSAAVRAIKQTIGDPYIAELFDDQLVSVVEKARQLHRVLDREKKQLAKAQRAAEAREVLTDWVSRFNAELPASTDQQDDGPDNPLRISQEDEMALWRIQKSIDYRVRVASQDVPRRLGATRQTGGAREREKNRREREKDPAGGAVRHWGTRLLGQEGKPQQATARDARDRGGGPVRPLWECFRNYKADRGRIRREA